MEKNNSEVKQIAAQLLSGMLSNPHIYAILSDEGVGQQEQHLMTIAIEMAEKLIKKVDNQT